MGKTCCSPSIKVLVPPFPSPQLSSSLPSLSPFTSHHRSFISCSSVVPFLLSLSLLLTLSSLVQSPFASTCCRNLLTGVFLTQDCALILSEFSMEPPVSHQNFTLALMGTYGRLHPPCSPSVCPTGPGLLCASQATCVTAPQWLFYLFVPLPKAPTIHFVQAWHILSIS